jgi:hypothetical protein
MMPTYNQMTGIFRDAGNIIYNITNNLSGNGKTIYLLINGVPTSVYGFHTSNGITVRVNSSNSTLMSVGDVVEMYVA